MTTAEDPTTAHFDVFCPGMLEVLSIGKGDLKLSVGGDNPEDTEKARKMIEEMLSKGYAIFVETEQGQRRVKKFNPKRLTYIVSIPDEPSPLDPVAETHASRRAAKPRSTKPKEREVPVAGSRATAVGRTAGG